MIKNFVFILILTLSYGDSFSQSKYGVDSVSCITNLSLFREYYKQKNYMEALSPWRWTFQNCPKASGNIYKNGPIIIKSMIKERPEQKKEYVDTLMLIYDQRIEYFGNEGYVLGRKGADLLRYDKSKFLDANEILARSIALQKNSSDAGAVLAYFNTLDIMVKNEIISEDSLLNRYSALMSIIDYNLKKNDKKSKFYQKTSDAIDKKIVSYIDCGKIENIFQPKFTINNNDTDFVNRLYNILSKQNCTDTEFHFQVSKRLHELLPSSISASKLGKICVKRKEFNQAIEYFDMAIEIEEDSDKRAKYLLEKADAYRISKNYTNAILTAKQSIELKSIHVHDEYIHQRDVLLDSRTIDENVRSNLANTLSYQPNIGVISFGSVTSKPIIRGLSGDRFLLTKDGMQMGDLSQTAIDHVISLDITEVSNIELIRGPRALFFGSNPIGGVLNTTIIGDPKSDTFNN